MRKMRRRVPTPRRGNHNTAPDIAQVDAGRLCDARERARWIGGAARRCIFHGVLENPAAMTYTCPAMDHPTPHIESDRTASARIQQSLGCSDIIAGILVRRGIDTPEKALQFLECPLTALRDPLHLRDMTAAVERLVAAVRNQESILVFGDYDADGVCATCLLLEFFQDCGLPVAYHIPHRISDGYGFLPEVLENNLVPQGTRVIITVDCGITSHEAVAMANQRGIDVIITDHHEADDRPPAATAVINPKQSSCTAGVEHLSGVGVAFYLTIALRAGLRSAGYWSSRRPEPNMMAYIDLVAIGTLADMVPLVGENRIMVRRGMQQLRRGQRPGLVALMGKETLDHLTSDDITYRLVPPINAAGRLRHADRAVGLLLCRIAAEAQEKADHLLKLNARRKDLEQRIYDTAVSAFEAAAPHGRPMAIVLADPQWHLGVLGIVAARLSRDHDVPAILFTKNGDQWKGSGRSPEGIDLMACLTRCRAFIHAFGGHTGAAGLTLTDDQMAEFPEQFTRAVTDEVSAISRVPPVTADVEIPFSAVTPRLADALQSLEPFGQGNPEPCFLSRDLRVVSAAAVGDRHCRMVLSPQDDARGHRCNAIYFNAPQCPSPGAPLAALSYRIRWNTWNGRRTLQLLVSSITLRQGGR